MIFMVTTGWRRIRDIGWIPLFIISATLTTSLIRNTDAPSFWQAVSGLSAIGLCLLWGGISESTGYCWYAVNISSQRNIYLPMTFSQARFRSPLCRYLMSHPVGMSLVLICALIIFCHLIWQADIEYRYLLLWMIGSLALPGLCLFQFRHAFLFHLNRVITLQEVADSKIRRPVIGRWQQIALVDLTSSLLVNLALVLPLNDKPSFSVAKGYLTPEFLVAFNILMVIVMLCMCTFAKKRSRRYAFLGELAGNIQQSSTQPYPLPFRLGGWSYMQRVGCWLFLSMLTGCLLPLLFSWLNAPLNFAVIYLCALLPIAMIYWFERKQSLLMDLNDANEMWQRVKYQQSLI